MQNYKFRWDDKRQNIRISNKTITDHAIKQYESRLSNLISLDEIIDSMEKHKGIITKYKHKRQVMLVVKSLNQTITVENSTGNLIVACIDPRTSTIKTLMLRNSEQMGKKVS